jgi:hypothetical protein
MFHHAITEFDIDNIHVVVGTRDTARTRDSQIAINTDLHNGIRHRVAVAESIFWLWLNRDIALEDGNYPDRFHPLDNDRNRWLHPNAHLRNNTNSITDLHCPNVSAYLQHRYDAVLDQHNASGNTRQLAEAQVRWYVRVTYADQTFNVNDSIKIEVSAVRLIDHPDSHFDFDNLLRVEFVWNRPIPADLDDHRWHSLNSFSTFTPSNQQLDERPIRSFSDLFLINPIADQSTYKHFF